MKLLAGNDFSCKVEIMPIDNQKDHYYIMTQKGAPIVKIMPPYSSGNSDQSLDHNVFNYAYQGRDMSMTDLVNQDHNTTDIRVTEGSVYLEDGA